MASGLERDEYHSGKVVVRGANGEAYAIDSSTNAMTGINYSHHEIHGGSAYVLHATDVDLDTDAELSISFITANTDKLCHLVMAVANTVASIFEMLEAPTITDGTGSDIVPLNRRRDSTNTSGILSIKATPIVNEATLGATITADGTVLWEDTLGATRNFGTSTGSTTRDEWILAPNTRYAFRLTGLADNGLASLGLNWYEHTDKA